MRRSRGGGDLEGGVGFKLMGRGRLGMGCWSRDDCIVLTWHIGWTMSADLGLSCFKTRQNDT